jgi:hypothetical protein
VPRRDDNGDRHRSGSRDLGFHLDRTAGRCTRHAADAGDSRHNAQFSSTGSRGLPRHSAYFDKQQQIEEILALLSALGLTVADLGGIPPFLRRAPAPTDAAKAGEAEPAAGEGTKH